MSRHVRSLTNGTNIGIVGSRRQDSLTRLISNLTFWVDSKEYSRTIVPSRPPWPLSNAVCGLFGSAMGYQTRNYVENGPW